jgi:hypothetical protein
MKHRRKPYHQVGQQKKSDKNARDSSQKTKVTNTLNSRDSGFQNPFSLTSKIKKPTKRSASFITQSTKLFPNFSKEHTNQGHRQILK